MHAAAESFAAWDLDKSGALSFETFRTVIDSLADPSSPLDEPTARRLFALLDADQNGVVDMNEFLAFHKRLQDTT